MSINDDYLSMSKQAAAREADECDCALCEHEQDKQKIAARNAAIASLRTEFARQKGWDVCSDQTAPAPREPLRVVLLNGPPRAGKDYAAAALVREYHGAGLVKFAGPLKRATHEAFGLTDRADAHYENCKDEPHPDFGGLTPRAAYIAMSEQGIKPAFGDAHFGTAAVNRMRDLYSRGLQLAVVSDSGFVGEALEVVKAFGPENVLLIQLFRDGYRFKGDSRSYVNLPEDVSWCIVRNEGNATFTDKIKARVRAWLAGELA